MTEDKPTWMLKKFEYLKKMNEIHMKTSVKSICCANTCSRKRCLYFQLCMSVIMLLLARKNDSFFFRFKDAENNAIKQQTIDVIQLIQTYSALKRIRVPIFKTKRIIIITLIIIMELTNVTSMIKNNVI